ncbi:hypothetical protein DAY19_14345 [Halobacteriovorax vibrionivorans]|uniref:Uncharacterized protein n=1 Tax=Halobacteriovorax vibrionivorans TaxID=2152716 RepID=A0ABY0IF49_9BACT|nr:hypothetical protein [Halobacteriovorax vibrionivorans]RZF21154.1 hypothetical protein DAY19_14345 [Halobacteriovorax vibrionivorans]
MKLSVSNFDFTRTWINVPCPACKLDSRIQLRDVVYKRAAICRGCKSNLKLKDTYDSTKLGLRKITKQINNIFR